MIETFNIIAAVFGIIALGYGLARFPMFGGDLYQKLTVFVFWVPIPALMFRTLATADFKGGNALSVWGAYFPALAVIWICGYLLSRYLFKMDGAKSTVAGLTASFSNNVLVGMPIVLSVYGEDGLPPLLLIISIHTPIMMMVTTVLIEKANLSGQNVDFKTLAGQLFRNLSRNSIVLSVIAGTAWRFTGWGISGPVESIIDQLAGISAPTALFTLGLSLYQFGFSRQFWPPVSLGVLKLFAFPALVFLAILYVFDLPREWIGPLVVCAACPSGVVPYLMASHFKTGEQLASQTITMTTFVAIVTIAFWIHFVS